MERREDRKRTLADYSYDLTALEIELRRLLEEVRATTGVPGISVALSVNGQRLALAVGESRLDSGLALSTQSRFQLGCITKLLTSLVALELAKSGQMCLDALVTEYLPDLEAAFAGRNIAVRHLGTHTSGYQGLSPATAEAGYFYSWQKLTVLLCSGAQVFAPGTVFNYEHTECVILGEIIHRLTGTAPDELVRAMLAEPLRLQFGTIKSDSSAPEVSVADHSSDPVSGRYGVLRTVPYGKFWLASLSDLTASPSDLVTLGEVLNGIRHIPDVSSETVSETRRQVVPVPPMFGGPGREQMPVSFGFGCAEYSGGLFGHNGSARGQTCGFRFDPRRQIAIVVALNCWQPHLRDHLLDRLSNMLSSVEARSVPSCDQLRWNWAELEGRYVGCIVGAEAIVSVVADQLVCTIQSQLVGTKLKIPMARDRNGFLITASDVQHLTVGFFRDRTSELPCIMFGMNAFRKAP